MQFIASTNLKSLLGRGLVTDQLAAIFELVKNSYDADANEVHIEFEGLLSEHPQITISDDGSGMGIDDIKDKWMVIGTDSKKNILYSPIYRRPLNGDKGIGRFSVDRLGAKLKLTSTGRYSKKRIEMNFDWNLFENSYQNLSDIEIPYELSETEYDETGVSLVISELRDEWNVENIRKLIKNLRQFKSPFANEDNFRIFIHAPELGFVNYEIVIEELGTVSSLWVEAECREDNLDLVYLNIYKDGIEYEEIIPNAYNIGPVKMKIYSFNQGDKIRFKNRFSVRVREFGNIRLYRDEFRIYPYGEENNDWLDVDRRHAQGFARTFSSRDLIGYVQTYKQKNENLIPLTNRQGLIENEAYHFLRKFIVEYGIVVLERYYFQKFKINKNETFENTKNNIEESTKNLSTIAKQVEKYDKDLGRDLKQHISNLKKEHDKQIKYVQDQQELTKVYSRIAQSETLLHQIIHQALLDLKDAKTAIEQLGNRKEIKENEAILKTFLIMQESVESSMTKMLTVRDDIARTRHKQKIDLSKELHRLLNLMKPEFEKYNISLYEDIEKEAIYYIDLTDFKSIINNLVSNSIKALREIEDRKRKINVSLKISSKYFIMKIQDNGCGISEVLREKIFDPFFSTTQKYGGFGLGLTIVDEVLKEYDGALELVETNEEGACFYIKLRR